LETRVELKAVGSKAKAALNIEALKISEWNDGLSLSTQEL